MDEERTIACTLCACAPVCVYSEQFKKIQAAIDNVSIDGLRQDDGKLVSVKLSNVPWVKTPINLECVHYYPNRRVHFDDVR